MAEKLLLACPCVDGDRIAAFEKNITKWIKSPILNELVEAFGGNVPAGLDLYALSKWLLEFSDCWDFRAKQQHAFDSKIGEGARWLVDGSGLNESQNDIALAAAETLGLRGNSSPQDKDWDYILVLGGARLSCLLRSRLAAETIKNTGYKPRAVALLASMRKIGDSERNATDTYAPNASTEFDLCVAAAERELNVSEEYTEERHDDINNANNSWVVRKHVGSDCDVYVVAAPSSDPTKRRAHTADTYEFFLRHFDVSEGSSILLSTSEIYVPYQHVEAVRTVAIPHCVYLETVGFPREWNGSLQGMNEPSNYLQEIRSTIQAIDRWLSHCGRNVNQ